MDKGPFPAHRKVRAVAAKQKESLSMPKIVKQSRTLPASAQRLYDMYLSPRGHKEITGMKATIGKAPGSPFSAFNGALSGKTLYTVPRRLIVQSWRSTAFGKRDIDSTLVLTFTPKGRSSTRVDLVHVNVADRDYKGVSEGWPKYYWKPWRKALRRPTKRRQ
jgi:Activator of Hsp90 ATPase homolog 1-like protein